MDVLIAVGVLVVGLYITYRIIRGIFRLFRRMLLSFYKYAWPDRYYDLLLADNEKVYRASFDRHGQYNMTKGMKAKRNSLFFKDRSLDELYNYAISSEHEREIVGLHNAKLRRAQRQR